MGTSILGAVWLGLCHDHVVLLNGTYANATLMLENATADVASLRNNFTTVTDKLDDALAQVHNLTETINAKDKNIKAAKKAGRRADKKAVKKAEEAHREAMATTEAAHAQALKTNAQTDAKAHEIKDAKIAALEAELSSTCLALTASQETATHLGKTLEQHQTEGRALRETMAKHLVASKEHLRRVGQTLGFFLAMNKEQSLQSGALQYDLRMARNFQNASESSLVRSSFCPFTPVCVCVCPLSSLLPLIPQALANSQHARIHIQTHNHSCMAFTSPSFRSRSLRP